MQVVKLVILFFTFMFFLPEICQAKQVFIRGGEEKICSNINDNAATFTSTLLNLLDNAGELTSDISHNTYDKKSYLRLFNYPRYSKTHPAVSDSSSSIFHVFLPDRPERISYYIYTLRKIII